MSMVITLYDAKSKGVIGWRTPCARCGTSVTFKKGPAGKDRTPAKPDEHALCSRCWASASAAYQEKRVTPGGETH